MSIDLIFLANTVSLASALWLHHAGISADEDEQSFLAAAAGRGGTSDGGDRVSRCSGSM